MKRETELSGGEILKIKKIGLNTYLYTFVNIGDMINCADMLEEKYSGEIKEVFFDNGYGFEYRINRITIN